MKRMLIVVALLVLFVSSSFGDGQTRKRRRTRGRRAPVTRRTSTAATGKKTTINCPATLNSINDCPDTGCGLLDPNLNKQKNIATDSQAAVKKDFQDLAALPDPVPDFKIGDTREKLAALGEGQKITVVAYALVARKGNPESCNCGLSLPSDTDNHIVLVDTALETGTSHPSLAANEKNDSQTAEFTPRVRLTHPKLAGVGLQSLITAAPNQALLVRVTGLLMFDSEHSLGPFHLKRHNNWEIHPVMGLEFCPTGKSCTADSDVNWKSIEN